MNQNEIFVDNITRVPFHSYLFNNLCNAPFGVLRYVSHNFCPQKKGTFRCPSVYSGFCSGFEMAMVSPASPTLNRAKRLTEIFSPSFPILVVISCRMVWVWSLMKGC